MILKQGTASEQPKTRQGCCHYWLIEAADGRTSQGVCRFCGEQKLFDNYVHVNSEKGGDDVENWDDHIPAPKLTPPKVEQADSKQGTGATRNEYTRADFSKWGAMGGRMGGRGNKKKA